MDLRESLDKPVSEYVSTTFVKVSLEDSVAECAAAMRKASSTEAVVMDDGGLVGIVTERDILYKVVAEGLDPRASKLRNIMSTPVEIVDESTRVRDAISMMSKLGIRRLAVTKNGRFIGLLTQVNMASGMLGQNVALPELARPGSLSCPYCGATLKDSSDLSKHIDHVHLGTELLERSPGIW
jgi:CBS domain-containing protein